VAQWSSLIISLRVDAGNVINYRNYVGLSDDEVLIRPHYLTMAYSTRISGQQT
jgi:hypothetical protein